jgi:hypothetical protein
MLRTMSALTIAIAGALVGGGVSGALAWAVRSRFTKQRSSNVVRAAARELYRELPRAAEQLSVIDQARTYGELRKAFPELPGWLPIRQRLAEHAVEGVWEPLSYQVGKLEMERGFLNSHGESEPLTKDRQRRVHYAAAEALRGISAVLAGILPSEREPEIAQILPPLEKHSDLTYFVQREAANAGYH